MSVSFVISAGGAGCLFFVSAGVCDRHDCAAEGRPADRRLWGCDDRRIDRRMDLRWFGQSAGFPRGPGMRPSISATICLRKTIRLLSCRKGGWVYDPFLESRRPAIPTMSTDDQDDSADGGPALRSWSAAFSSRWSWARLGAGDAGDSAVYHLCWFVPRRLKGIPMFTKVQRAQDRMISVVRENAQGHPRHQGPKAEHEKNAVEKKSIWDCNEELKANTDGRNQSADEFVYESRSGRRHSGRRLAGQRGLERNRQDHCLHQLLTIIANAMMSISRIFVMYSKGVASADRIEEVLQAQDEMEIITDDAPLNDKIVEFDHVSFSYLGVKDNVEILRLN